MKHEPMRNVLYRCQGFSGAAINRHHIREIVVRVKPCAGTLKKTTTKKAGSFIHNNYKCFQSRKER